MSASRPRRSAFGGALSFQDGESVGGVHDKVRLIFDIVGLSRSCHLRLSETRQNDCYSQASQQLSH